MLTQVANEQLNPLAEAGAQVRRVSDQQARWPRSRHGASFGSRRRRPVAATWRAVRRCTARFSAPADVIWYGRLRSSAGSASIQPRSSSLLSAPYSVPGPSLIPANDSISLASAYPCLGPSASLLTTSTTGSGTSTSAPALYCSAGGCP